MEHKQEFLIVGKTDIEKAVFLLREIDAFLSFNISPLPAQMTEMRKTIQEFTSLYCSGKPGFGNFIENKEANTGNTALDVWTRRTKGNVPLAERSPTASPDQHSRRQGAASLEDAARPKPMERTQPDVSGNRRSNGIAMERTR